MSTVFVNCLLSNLVSTANSIVFVSCLLSNLVSPVNPCESTSKFARTGSSCVYSCVIRLVSLIVVQLLSCQGHITASY